MFLFLLVYITVNTYPYDVKYNDAVKTATEASYKQSGAEADFLRVKNSATDKSNIWLRNNGLAPIASVGAAVVPVILYRKIRVKERNIIFEGYKDKVSATWTLQF